MADERPLARLALVACVAAGASAFFAFDALPFQDLPAHAGLIAARSRFASSPLEQAYFLRGPTLGPYALFLLLGELFVRLLGPEGAARALGALPVLATPLALLFARRRLHGDRSLWAGFAGVALSFGFLNALGLASFLFALALAMAALVLWVELLARVDAGGPATARTFVFALVALGVALAHGHALLLLFALSSFTAVARAPRLLRLARLAAFLPAAGLLAWSALLGGAPPGSSDAFVLAARPDYQTLADKLSLLLTPTLATRLGVDVLAGLVLWAILVVSLRASLRGPAPVTRDLAVAAGGALLLFFALPHAYLWFGFIDGRMVPVFFFVAILAVDKDRLSPRLARALDLACPACAVAVTGVVLFAEARFQDEARGFREVLAQVPAEARLLNLPLDPDSRFMTAHPFVHYDKLVLARAPVLLSDVWADRASALYPRPDHPALRLPATYDEANLKTLDWPSYRLEDWTHILVRTRPDAPPPEVPGELVLAAHEGGFWLYRR